MEDSNLSYQESLRIINDMIHKAKRSYHDTGIGAMLWGTIIAFCSLVKLAEIRYGFKFPFDVYLLTLFALIPQIFITIKERRSRKAKAYNDRFISFVWLAFGLSIFLLSHTLNGMSANWSPVWKEYELLAGHKPTFKLSEYTAAFFLMLYGMPTFITGATYSFKPMLYGGIFCWVCCVITVYTSIQIDLLLTALSAIAAWLIPGLLMKKAYDNAKKGGATDNV